MVAIPYPILERYRWTVDVEYDWGGRTNGIIGLLEGLPRIRKAFRDAKIKALFFVSTETLEDLPFIVEEIRRDGHEIGSHGHFHVKFKDAWRADRDRKLSTIILSQKLRVESKIISYRANKFSHRTDCVYSQPKNHVSLLKHMWLREKIQGDTIIYLHPFDIVETGQRAPNLFCKFWYSRPKQAYKLFQEMVNTYK